MADAASLDLDDLYAYDGLHRLTDAERGELAGTKDAITTLAFAQTYGLDQLNNWANFVEDSDGDATDDLDQDRTHNDANEITDITESTGPAWATPAHDAAGNMTTIPQLAAPTSTYTLTWDAWNRLVKVADGMDTVAEYEYDGFNRRIVKAVYSGGSLDHTEHRYLSEQDQVLEVRIDSDTDPYEQFTWGERYVDDLVMRTRDTDANGSLDETLYALQETNWHITALADTSGTITERFQYDPYGKSTVLDADFSADSDGLSDYDWETRFTSREFDPETNLHYFRARYYHDGLGRFIGRDPMQCVDGASLYAAYFVSRGSDPSGRQLVAPLYPGTIRVDQMSFGQFTKTSTPCPKVNGDPEAQCKGDECKFEVAAFASTAGGVIDPSGITGLAHLFPFNAVFRLEMRSSPPKAIAVPGIPKRVWDPEEYARVSCWGDFGRASGQLDVKLWDGTVCTYTSDHFVEPGGGLNEEEIKKQGDTCFNIITFSAGVAQQDPATGAGFAGAVILRIEAPMVSVHANFTMETFCGCGGPDDLGRPRFRGTPGSISMNVSFP